jgi:DnaA-homolog protein
MNHQLALAIHLNLQATLADFCWGANQLLQQQLESSLLHDDERFLYLWGDAGSGKSHLLQGCCHAMSSNNKSAAYLPLALLKEWGPESIEGMEEQALIALDDIDAIASDSAWEEAIFHLYNRVRDNGKTILLIAGKNAPSATSIQLADLRSRLTWGLVFQIHELSDELKITTLQQHAHERGFELSDSVALFLLNRCARSMHALYQLLDKLDEASLAAQRKITVPFVKSILGI